MDWILRTIPTLLTPSKGCISPENGSGHPLGERMDMRFKEMGSGSFPRLISTGGCFYAAANRRGAISKKGHISPGESPERCMNCNTPVRSGKEVVLNMLSLVIVAVGAFQWLESHFVSSKDEGQH
ncbi:hypothetical protein CDAR_47601 [Caerostris darwini]|uniref:Uncharacterized protein n=1 Tax=Caerostris darwini TaxID=1538125 RepID=A0AAV4M891_9ARAC|nr:hypothetical protein CDAR_47601 [Caerostris darwini]